MSLTASLSQTEKRPWQIDLKAKKVNQFDSDNMHVSTLGKMLNMYCEDCVYAKKVRQKNIYKEFWYCTKKNKKINDIKKNGCIRGKRME